MLLYLLCINYYIMYVTFIKNKSDSICYMKSESISINVL